MKAPVLRDALELAAGLLALLEAGDRQPELRRALAGAVLRLVDEVTQAVATRPPEPHLQAADRALAVLRSRLILAAELGLLPPGACDPIAERVDRIGRQVGGWLKKRRADGGGRTEEARPT